MSRANIRFAAAVLSAVAAFGIGITAADAKCARLGFSVNDYGKAGPTKDAQALLDKHIASWTAERGIKGYTASKKDISCELFLDFGVFDEHTCKASATVCWPDGAGSAQKAKVDAPPAGAAPKAAPAPAAPAAKPKAS